MTSIANLRKNKKTRLETLQQKASESTPKTYKDDRFWNLAKDPSTGVGTAVIRFMFSKEEKDKIAYYHHGFQDPITNKWLISICPTSHFGEKEYSTCPVCEANGKIYEEGKKDQFSRQKRKKNFVANIYVVKDPSNPENEGKVFLYKYPLDIDKKITAMLVDEFDETNSVDVFDFDTGKDFLIKTCKNSGGWISYDDSKFRDSNCFAGKTDEQLEAIFQQSYSLDDLVALEAMPKYEDLKKNYERVTAKTSKSTKLSEEAMENEEEYPVQPERKEKSVPIDDGEDLDELNDMMNSILNSIEDE